MELIKIYIIKMNYKKLLFAFALLTIQSITSYGQVSLTNASPSNTIDFSSSMQSTVGNGAYTAAGFQATPTVGQLNSNAWAVTGWSDGALAFGGTQTTGATDYTRGPIAAAVTTGGFYSYTGTPHSVANPCFMIQPGTADLTPGTVTLRIQNNGTTNITDLAVSYNLFVRNDQGRSNSLNFSYSPDNTTYTSVGALDYTSTVAADALGWVQVGTSPSRTTTITGLAITPGSFYYIRWSANDVGGSGSRDEFGLDDITITATYPSVTITSANNGPWSVGSTWVGGVAPVPGNSVVIVSPHEVYLDGNVTRNAGTTLTVNAGGTLRTDAPGSTINNFTYTNNGIATINGTFQIDNAGGANGTTNFTYGAAGTLNFNNASSKTVTNSDVFWPTTNGPFNVNVVGDISISAGAPRTVAGTFSTGTKFSTGVTTTTTSRLTLNGTIRIDANGQFATAASAPIYGNASTLVYNTGGTYLRFREWDATGAGTIGTTPGYPNNVQISSGTTWDFNGATIARACFGNLTIDAGCTFTMPAATTGDLTIGGSVTNNGSFLLSVATTPIAATAIVMGNYTNNGTTTMAPATNPPSGGGHLRLSGNFINGVSGVFNGNTGGGSKFVQFVKNGTQSIQNLSASTLVLPNVQTFGSTTTIQLLSDLTISAPTAGGLILGTAGDIFDINGRTLTIGTTGIANGVSGLGTIKGSTTSNLTLLGTGSIGTLRFTTGFQNLGTFTIDRTASSVGCVMGTPVTINTNLVLTNGHVDLGATTMTLANGVNPTGSVNSHVIADVSAGGILNKVVTATGTNYIFPVGNGGTEYAPATVNYTAGTFASATLGMAVENPATGHPNWSTASSYIKRYWSLTSSGITTPTYNFSATYPITDVVGAITPDFKSNQWDGTDWTNGGTVITAGTISKTGCTLNTGTNHISAAIRNQEIEVKSGVAGITIPSGTTTTAAFGNAAYNTVNIGSNLAHTFSIYNRGNVALNLTGAPIVEILAGSPAGTSGDFTVTTQPSSTTVNGESSLTFVITFSPTYSGYRSATVRISNNDSDENPYTFIIDGNGQCVTTPTNTITPTSGPVGTEVTITATTGTLTAATATFNGVSATVTPIDATHIIATVPTGAVPGALVTTSSTGCQASNVFTVIDNASTSCQGGTSVSELFISEVTDSNYGSLTYLEIYNGTSSAKNLGTYSIKVANNGGAYTLAMTLNSVSLPAGSSYIVAFGNDGLCGTPGGNGSYAAQSSAGSSINFAVNAHDHYGLFNGATQIDSWGVFGNNNWAPASIGTEGVSFRRKNNVTVPNTTYSNSDWNIVDYLGSGAASCSNNDYSDIGTFNFLAGTPPTVTTLTYTATCKGTTLTVTGGEGFVGGVGLIYKWYAVANGSNTWNLITDGGIYSGASTNTLTISDISTIVDYQFYCEVWENTNTCFRASNAIKIVPSSSTTWTAAGWSNGIPTLNKAAIITSNYDTANASTSPFPSSFDACSLTINSPAIVSVQANDYINIKNDLTVNSGATLNIENNGSLVMINDNGIVTNNGTTNIKRTSTPYERYDYIYWSSPVAAANSNIALTFAGWRTDYSFEFNTANFYDSRTINSAGTVTAVTSDSFDDVAPWAWQNYSGNMTSGKGYAIMAPTSVTFSPSAPGAPVTFSGKVNNGIVSLPLVQTANTDAGFVGVNNPNDDYNFVGNPYPSALFADKFITDNGLNTSGTLYFWTHVLNISNTNPGPSAYNFISDDYALYNMTGGTRASLTTPASAVPTGYIGSGQGFFVEAQSSNNLVFNNSMRSKTYSNSQFFKTIVNGVDQKDRFWLNLMNADGMFGQQLIGYFDNTTLGFDWAYDGRVNLSNNYVSFYSIAGDEKYKIQARPAFDRSDIVPLGYFSAVTGEFTIGIDKKEGVFDLDSTPIYLEDKEMNIIHNLKESAYTFTTNYGRFEDRFVLRYANTSLGNPDFETLDSSVSVATNHGEMIIKSHIENIQDVTVYDILGRQLFESKKIVNNNFTASNISSSQQTLIVKIKLENGFTVTRKIIL